MMAWAAGFPAVDGLLVTWPPVALIVARLGMALGILLPLWCLIDGLGSLRGANWGRALVVGGIGFGLGTWLLLVAQWYTDPVTVALIAACTPITATIVELVYRQRRLRAGFALGLAASVLGGVIGVGELPPGTGLWTGIACAVAAGFLFSWASLMAVRDFPDLSPLGRSTITFVGAFFMATILYVIHSFAGFDTIPSAPVTGHQIGLLAIYALAAMALSQILFIASVSRIGVALTTIHANLAPFYVMIIMLNLGHGWSWQQAAGAAIIAAGVLMSQRN